MRRSDQLIAVDFADEAGSLNLRRDSGGEIDILLQVDGCLRERKVVVDTVLEHDADERQAIERRRANDIDARRRSEADLDRDRVVALHFLRGQAWRLRRDLENHRRRVWVRLDVKPEKRERARAN